MDDGAGGSLSPGEGLIGCGIDTVTTDQTHAVALLIDWLVQQGHRKIAHLTGDLASVNGQVRRDAWRAAMSGYGLALRPEWQVEGHFVAEGCAEAVLAWYLGMKEADRPSALFAANDVMALAVLKGMKQAGIAIPGQLALCGFDNVPEANYCEPGLTSVGQDNEAIGRIATGLLIDQIEHGSKQPPVSKILQARLFVRASG